MRDVFPRQFRFIPVVLAPPPGMSALETARFLKEILLPHRDGAPVPENDAILDALHAPAAPPECLDVEAGIAALPDEKSRQIVRAGSAELSERLSHELPRVKGESDIASRVTALASACVGLPAGTVVYDRRTDRSHVLFLLQHMFIDLRTGIHRVVGLPELPSPASVMRRAPPQDTRAMTPGTALDVMAAYDPETGHKILAGMDTTKDCILGAASCLAWAAGPYGPAIAGGVTILQTLIGGQFFDNSDGGPSVEELLEQSTLEIKKYIDTNSIRGHTAELRGFSTWITSIITEMGKVKAGSDPEASGGRDFVAKIPEHIRDLRTSTGPNGTAYNALFDLMTNYLDTDEGLEQCLLAVSLYLLALKLIMQLESQQIAWLTGKPGADTSEIQEMTSLWLNDYSTLVTAFDGGAAGGKKKPGGVVTQAAADLTAAVSKRKKDRMAKLSDSVSRVEMECVDPSAKGEFVFGTYHDWGWYWKDGEVEHKYIDRWVETGSGCKAKTSKVSFETQARADYDNHRAAVVAELERKYGHVEPTIQSWMRSIQDWRDHTPPGRPISPPRIDPDGWTGKPPPAKLAPAWVEGSVVSYAVSFVNNCGISHQSEFSDPEPIRPGAGVTLFRFPEDPLKRAAKIQIHRRITNSLGTNLDRIAGVVDVGTTRWHDGTL